MNNKNQLTVIGATGNLGIPVVHFLSDFGFRIKIIARNPAKASQLFSNLENIEIVQADLTDPQSLELALKDSSHLYLNLSTHSTDMNVPFAAEREGIANIIDSVDRQSIRQIIAISGLGALDNIHSPKGFEFIPNSIRKQGHRLIKESGIPYTILHCSWFLDCFVFYKRKSIYTVIGNNKTPLYFTNGYDYTLHLVNAIDNKDALYREFPIQGREGFIHSNAAKQFLEIYSESAKVKVLSGQMLNILALFSREMGFVKQLADYSNLSPESFLSEECGTYKSLGLPTLNLKEYAKMLKEKKIYK